MNKADKQFFVAITQFFNSGGTAERAHALVDQAANETGKAGQISIAENGQSCSAGLSQLKPSEGQAHHAHQGQAASALARSPLPDDGHGVDVLRDQISDAVVGAPKPSEGQRTNAHQGQDMHANARPPLSAGQVTPASQGHYADASGNTRGEANAVLLEQGQRASTSPRVTVSMHTRKPPAPPRIAKRPIGGGGPTPAQRRAMLTIGHHSVPTIFDTYKVPDGRPIGNVTWNELSKLVSTNMRWMSIFQQVRAHGVPADPNAKIRDIITEAKLKEIIEASGKITIDAERNEGVLMSPSGKWSVVREAVA